MSEVKRVEIDHKGLPFFDDRGVYVFYEAYAALQQKLDAVLAENVKLKRFCKNAAFDADYESELGMDRGGFTDALNDIKTPATDAILNEVRAEVVEAFANGGCTYEVPHRIKSLLLNLADQLRSGSAEGGDE